MDRLSHWYDRWGLGRPTGIGIPEAEEEDARSHFAGPAFGTASARPGSAAWGRTRWRQRPIQMATCRHHRAARDMDAAPASWWDDREASTLGIRPLFAPRQAGSTPAEEDPGEYPDRVDLKPSRRRPRAAAATACRAVVIRGKAGTGKGLLHGASPELASDDLICGKTGTAQASHCPVKLVRRARQARYAMSTGRQAITIFLDLSTKDHPSTIAPWYRGNGPDGKDINHAWYIGFAPAD